MRLAILSDIHGNLVALKAVLSDLRNRRVKQIVCLGDVAATGPQPREVVELLRPLKWPCVMGNSDEMLAMDEPDLPQGKAWEQLSEEDKTRNRELDEWTRSQLSKSHRNYLATFKPTITLTPKKGPKLLCYHGSPRSNHDRIEAETLDHELTTYLHGYEANIFAGGHTHTQMLRRFRGSIVMNPGSIGLPFQQDLSGRIRNPTHAEYVILAINKKSFNLEFLSVHYSRAELADAVRGSGMPNSDWWLSDWF